MIEESDHQSPLAGAKCPKCGEVCVYEISKDLIRSQLDVIQIACHSCDHVFKTAIPDDARGSIENTPQPQQPPIEDHHPVIDELTPAIEDDVSHHHLEYETPRRSWIAYTAIGVVCVIILAFGIMKMINTSKSLRENALAGLEEAGVQKPIAQSEPAASPEPQQSSNTVTQPSQTQLPQFDITDRGYTISTTDLGTVMNIKVSVVNNGDSPAKPKKMILHLLSADGVILMTWPMITATTSNRDLIPPKATRQFSAQLVEPPEGAKTLEVEIQ